MSEKSEGHYAYMLDVQDDAPPPPAGQQGSEPACYECGGKGYVLEYREWDEEDDMVTQVPCSTCRPMIPAPPAAAPAASEGERAEQ